MADSGGSARQELGRYLRRARESLGWSLDHAAQRLEVEGVSLDPSTLSRLEKGRGTLTFETAGGLARCFGTSVAALDEIMRTARRRQSIDLTGWTFDGLIESGQQKVSEGDILAALDHFEAARDWVALQPNLDGRNDKLAQALTWETLSQLRLRNYVVAHELNGQALNLKGVSAQTRLRALIVQVMIGFVSGDLARARTFAHQVEDRLTDCDLSLRLFGFAVLGDLCFFESDFKAAIPWLEKARDACRALKKDRELARLQVTIGYCLHRCGHSENGLRIATEGLRAAQVGRFQEVAAFGHRYVGLTHLDRGDADDARRHFRKAAELAKALGLAHDQFLALCYLWRWSLRHSTQSEAARCARLMRDLLPQVDRHAPEVLEFLTAMREARKRARRPE